MSANMKRLEVTNTLAYHGYGIDYKSECFAIQGSYSQHFIFFVTYKWAK